VGRLPANDGLDADKKRQQKFHVSQRSTKGSETRPRMGTDLCDVWLESLVKHGDCDSPFVEPAPACSARHLDVFTA
jgi:hypothetical protein